jgi:DNA (cytosine-5)-methyltransferase 1
MLPDVHIIFGGFPCQDLSTAGRKAGLGGKRSSLFYEITRLAEELKPPFVFLENIAQGINRYEETIASEFDRIGYTARALKMSAFDVGANHERFRWFCLAHSNSINLRITDRGQKWTGWEEKKEHFEPSWWTREPMFSGVANGLPHRLERARALGNAVVPLQAREAFKRLIGIQ